MKKSELKKIVKEEYQKIVEAAKTFDGVTIEYDAKTNKRILHLPANMTGSELSRWVKKYKDELKGKPERP